MNQATQSTVGTAGAVRVADDGVLHSVLRAIVGCGYNAEAMSVLALTSFRHDKEWLRFAATFARGVLKRTLLMYGSHQMNYETVATQLEHGAHVNACDANGRNAMWYAVARDISTTGGSCLDAKVATIRLLCQHGAGLNAADDHGATPLMQAAAQNDYVVFNELVSLGADPDIGGSVDGKQCVHFAAAVGSVDMLRDIIALHPAANVRRDSQLRSPLHYAASAGQSAAVSLFLTLPNREETLERGDQAGLTPLLSACSSTSPGAYSVATLLFSAGADIMHVDGRGLNALHHACDVGNLDVVVFLLESGCAPFVNDRDNYWQMSPIMHACGSRNLDLVKYLYAFRFVHNGVTIAADINDENLDGAEGTCLQQAVNSKSIEVVDWLLDHGLDVNDSRTGRTALFAACSDLDLPMVKLLISRGADVNLPSYGCTPLATACRADADQEMLSVLMDSGADPKVVAEHGSALHYARSVDAATTLLERGCPVDARAEHTLHTALHRAVYDVTAVSLVAALIDAGAPIDAVDNDGNTALGRTVSWDGDERLDSLQVLLLRGADVTTINKRGGAPMHVAAVCNSPGCIELMCYAGCDVDIRNEQGTTPLMLACKFGNIDCVKRLLSHGADVQSADKQHRTPLHYALADSRGSQINIAEALLKAGAELNSKTHEPALTAAALAPFDNSSIIKYLIDRGAKVNQRRTHGKTALYSAIYRGHPSNIKALADAGADVTCEIGIRHAAPLIHAIRRKRLEAVESLLAAGASANARDPGYQPRETKPPDAKAFLADESKTYEDYEKISEHHAEVARRYTRRTDLNPIRPAGTALWFAMTCKLPDICAALIAAGADPDVRNHWGATVLVTACLYGYDLTPEQLGNGTWLSVIDELLEPQLVDGVLKPRAHVNAVDSRGWTALHEACADRKVDTVRKLLMWQHVAGMDINAGISEGSFDCGKGSTPLLLAINPDCLEKRPESLQIARMLLDHGANVHATTDRGMTALHIAASDTESADALRLLLNAGASVHAADEHGCTPLFRATSLACVSTLLGAGAGACIRSVRGSGPLHPFLASMGRVPDVLDRLQALDLLIRSGADVSSCNAGGRTPLRIACDVPYYDCADFAAQAPADGHPFIKRLLQEPACRATASVQVEESLAKREFGVQACATPLQAFVFGALSHSDRYRLTGDLQQSFDRFVINTVDMLLVAGADITPRMYATGASSSTLLIETIERSVSLPVFTHLISRGADIHCRRVNEYGSHGGLTALHLAAEKRLVPHAEALIAAGAGVNDADSDGCIPLIYAIDNHDVAMVRLLLRAGSLIEAKDATGSRPLSRACWRLSCEQPAESADALQIVQMLLDAGASPFLPAPIELDYPLDRWVYGRSPLFLVCSQQKMEALQLIVDRSESLAQVPVDSGSMTGFADGPGSDATVDGASITELEWNSALISSCGDDDSGSPDPVRVDIIDYLLAKRTFSSKALGRATLALAKHGLVALVRRFKALGAEIDQSDVAANVDLLMAIARLGWENDDIQLTRSSADVADIVTAYIVAGMDVFRDLESDPEVLKEELVDKIFRRGLRQFQPVPIIYALLMPRASHMLSTMVAAGVDLNKPVGNTGCSLLQYLIRRVTFADNRPLIKLLCSHLDPKPLAGDEEEHAGLLRLAIQHDR